MAFKIYSDGIRYLIFSEGIQDYELCEFLEIVGKERSSDVDDDIVTLLWEKNLPHVVYVLVEDFLDFDVAGGALTAPESQQEKISGIFRTYSAETTTSSPMLVPQHILTLTGEEAEWLRNSREEEERKKPLDEVVQIVCSVLAGERDPELFADFLDILVKLAERLAFIEHTNYLFSLVKYLRNLADHEQTPAERSEQIDGAIGRIFSKQAVKAVAQTIDTTEQISYEELVLIVHALGKKAIPGICELLGLVEKMKMRKAILQALIEMAHDTPLSFLPFLSDSRWYLVRNMIFILTRIAAPMVLEPVVAQMSHRELAVRKEVLTFLEKSPDPRAKTYILKFLRDESSAIRIKALQVLASSRSTFAIKPIVAMTASEQFAEAELAEKKAAYEALGELGGDQMLTLFREMLTKKFWFNKARERESVVCAVYGLLKVRSAAAVKLLEEARADKGDEAREIITKALEALGGKADSKLPGA
jgi:HEAT repeat protein